MPRALGVDVGVRKGLDLVLLDEASTVVDTKGRVGHARLGEIVSELRPDVLAIDSPPSWAIRGRSRQTERELRWFGIQSYGTPTERAAGQNRFYEWMRSGFEVFRVAEEYGYRRYAGGEVRGTAMEVFPHASAVVLRGCLPPPDVRKVEWRRSVLRQRGIDTYELRSADLVDAALAALTGLFALRGDSSALGDPREGLIVLPSRVLPASPYRRCDSPRPGAVQERLPRLSPCTCGDPNCDRLTAGEFAPGHDAKRKALLWRLARSGRDAVNELRRRRWELPPEMR